MGRGNWLPPQSDDAQFATIQPEHLYGEYSLTDHKFECQSDPTDGDATRWAFEDARQEILSLLPPSFREVERWVERESKVWAENGLAMLVTHEDDYNRLHLALVPLHEDDYHLRRYALACHHVAVIGPKFLARVAAQYGPLTIRNGAWTSSEYQPIPLAA